MLQFNPLKKMQESLVKYSAPYTKSPHLCEIQKQFSPNEITPLPSGQFTEKDHLFLSATDLQAAPKYVRKLSEAKKRSANPLAFLPAFFKPKDTGRRVDMV